jgi:MFS family permease
MTILGAFAGNFWQLLLVRIGLATGESGLPPAALATLSTRFDSRRLAAATSMFMLAPFIGGGLALCGGGGAPLAISYTKLSVNAMLKKLVAGGFEASLAYDQLTLYTQDHKEGANAFMQKTQAQVHRFLIDLGRQ